jgi:hypothetical protein
MEILQLKYPRLASLFCFAFCPRIDNAVRLLGASRLIPVTSPTPPAYPSSDFRTTMISQQNLWSPGSKWGIILFETPTNVTFSTGPPPLAPQIERREFDAPAATRNLSCIAMTDQIFRKAGNTKWVSSKNWELYSAARTKVCRECGRAGMSPVGAAAAKSTRSAMNLRTTKRRRRPALSTADPHEAPHELSSAHSKQNESLVMVTNFYGLPLHRHSQILLKACSLQAVSEV